MKILIKKEAVKMVGFMMVLFLCFNITSCATTQEERLTKVDDIGKSINDKLSGFLGNKPKKDVHESVNGRQVNHKAKSPLIHKFIYEASDADRFVFFYRGNDQQSIRFAETVKKYADEVDMKVEAYTFDNRSLPMFPKSTLAKQEIIEQYFGDNFDSKAPALFLFQYDSYAALISDREMSYLELIKKMNKNTEERIARNPKKYGY